MWREHLRRTGGSFSLLSLANHLQDDGFALRPVWMVQMSTGTNKPGNPNSSKYCPLFVGAPVALHTATEESQLVMLLELREYLIFSRMHPVDSRIWIRVFSRCMQEITVWSRRVSPWDADYGKSKLRWKLRTCLHRMHTGRQLLTTANFQPCRSNSSITH